MREVVEARVGAKIFGVAGLDRDGDVVGSVVVVHGVSLGRLRRGGVAGLLGGGRQRERSEEGEGKERAAHTDWIMLSKDRG
jgi:hypothetical protein